MNLLTYIKSALSLFTAVIMGLTALISPTPSSTDTAELISEEQCVLSDAIYASQGLATDGEYYYTSGSIAFISLTGLSKINIKTGETEKTNLGALPQSFIKDNYDHIGAIGYYDCKIYAPVEDKAEEEPLILIYDADTLEYTGTYYNMKVLESGKPLLDDGIPWCTIDYDNGYLYTSQFHHTNEILAYNLSDMSFSHKIILSEEIDRVQGCAYYGGKIYANCDPNDTNGVKPVYSIDCATGEVKLAFTRNTTGFGCETEGIAILTDESGDLLFRIADYDKTIALFTRTYKLK